MLRYLAETLIISPPFTLTKAHLRETVDVFKAAITLVEEKTSAIRYVRL
ncbi:hypothetical protein LQT97_12570 [Brucella pseudogrignonensis]|nr:hypothetical protein [Brucella pseudogrignonensis]MCD4512065.1 hypothetical protein [Brucella pseudogrignonensis]